VQPFNDLESEVRGYCRAWPTVFESASGWTMVDDSGRRYLDFFAGAGALNYGHNHPELIQTIIDHQRSGRVLHGLDMATTTKRDFLETFEEVVLRPRGLTYKVQFPGPTGTNAVEAALKLARKVTGRESVINFTNAFHGMTLGALSVTANSMKRRGAGVSLNNTTSMPYEGFLEGEADELDYLQAYLTDSDGGSGMDLPAAVIVETVQAEGGVNVASAPWLRRLERICREHRVLLIVDDIQAGCARTGPFFSFEEAGIRPDIVCLSKSLSGYGLPLAITLIHPGLDVWEPGEHNGTFRGHNPAFVTATAAMDEWTPELFAEAEGKGTVVRDRLAELAEAHPALEAEVRGRGLINGLACAPAGAAEDICRAAFERGLILETSGPQSQVVKTLPALVIEEEVLERGLDILSESVEAVVGEPALVGATR
jgi:diaminobutyrate-2-oxoglutarate transaminase